MLIKCRFFVPKSGDVEPGLLDLVKMYTGKPKSDTFFNYVYIMPDKLQNTTRHLYRLNNFNIRY